MLTTVAIIGLFTLLALGALAGLLDGSSQRSGWNKIAAARKEIGHDRQVIDELTVALQVWESQLELRERAVRVREEDVAARERGLPPEGGRPGGPSAA